MSRSSSCASFGQDSGFGFRGLLGFKIQGSVLA